jgi:hypothetical protein
MICPSCKKDTIPWLKLWFMSGYGTHRCSSCGAICRLRKSWPLKLVVVGLGFISALLGIHYHSWTVWGIATIIALTLDVLVDSHFRRSELADVQT